MSDARLDEALGLAERLRDELAAVALAAADEPWNQRAFGAPAAPLQQLADDADDLASRIALTRSDQR